MSSHAITLNKSWPAHLVRTLKINLDDYIPTKTLRWNNRELKAGAVSRNVLKLN